ncbi:MAG TPA: hypothetical protein VK480_11010 [Solirubrobacterales bacterium]|nr:hypothetical protein [Solirubrobacterales bacterium]
MILMIAGAVGLILGIFQEFIWSRRRAVPGDPAAMEERREVRDPNVPPRY